MSFTSFAFLALALVVLAARWTIGRRKTEPAYAAVLIAALLGAPGAFAASGAATA